MNFSEIGKEQVEGMVVNYFLSEGHDGTGDIMISVSAGKTLVIKDYLFNLPIKSKANLKTAKSFLPEFFVEDLVRHAKRMLDNQEKTPLGQSMIASLKEDIVEEVKEEPTN